jgi:hypothetical protein
MRTGRTPLAVASLFVLSMTLSACTGSPGSSVVVSSNATASPSVTFARYFFSASGIAGVLEVSSSPPSICYSTQSNPPRPISIVPGPAYAVIVAHAEVSYAPRNNDFCDRTAKLALVTGLLADPSVYHVRWRPHPGSPTTFSSFIIA